MVIGVLFRSLLIVVILDIIVSKDCRGAGKRLLLEHLDIFCDSASPLPLIPTHTAFVLRNVAWIGDDFAFPMQISKTDV